MQNIDLLQKLIVIDRDDELPVYLQLTQALIRSIRRGHLRKGLKLPGSRKLAGALNLNRMTVVSAYDELEAQGWIERISRKGTFVRHDLPEIKPQRMAGKHAPDSYPSKAAFSIEKPGVSFPTSGFPDLNKLIIDSGFPDTRLAPAKLLFQQMKSLSDKPIYTKYLRYGGPLGTPVLRQTLTSFLRDTRGLPISTNNLMVTRGAQMGINLAASLLLGKGDQVIMAEPGYFLAERTFKYRGATVHRVPVDDCGIIPGAIDAICRKKAVKLLYVVPHHHHPTTVTFSPGRRLELLQLAEKYGFAIIEDDFDYDFHYSSTPMMPMASLDHHGSVIYIGTLTKTLAPAIRLGFLIAPENVIQSIANIRRTFDWQGDSLMELGVAELYKEGTIARHIRKSRKLYRKRRDHFCKQLQSRLGDHISFKVPDGGMALWAKFVTADLQQVAQQTQKRGLIIDDGKRYDTDQTAYNSTRMGFASLSIKEQQKAIAILAQFLNGKN